MPGLARTAPVCGGPAQGRQLRAFATEAAHGRPLGTREKFGHLDYSRSSGGRQHRLCEAPDFCNCGGVTSMKKMPPTPGTHHGDGAPRPSQPHRMAASLHTCMGARTFSAGKRCSSGDTPSWMEISKKDGYAYSARPPARLYNAGGQMHAVRSFEQPHWEGRRHASDW